MFLSPLIKSPSLSYTILFSYLIIVLLHVKTKSTQNVLFRTTKHQRKKNVYLYFALSVHPAVCL